MIFLYLLLINALTFGAYWADKRAVQRRGWRVPEMTLLMLGFAGGTVGAIAGQRVLRHKTRKLSFQLAFWVLTMLQLCLVAILPDEIAAIISRFGH